jgi:hypothetical protein
VHFNHGTGSHFPGIDGSKKSGRSDSIDQRIYKNYLMIESL